MSTRSRIGIEYPDGTCRTVYCHYDGYPDGGVGETLVARWSSSEKVEDLLQQGNMSSLGDDLASCEFYHRDRGETLHPALEVPGRNDILREEYTYLWVVEQQRWTVADGGDLFRDLEELLSQGTEENTN